MKIDYEDYTMRIETEDAGWHFYGEWVDGEPQEQVLKEWEEGDPQRYDWGEEE